MASRLIREEILESKRFNELSPMAQNFFFRLMLVVDDYGRFYADQTVLRNKVYPRMDSIRGTDVGRWLNETEKTNPPMVRCYSVADEKFLEIAGFGQSKKAMKSQHPVPPWDNCPARSARTHNAPAARLEEKRIEENRREENKRASADATTPIIGEYPETVEDVIRIAGDAGVIMPLDEAEKYLTFREASDWVDAQRRTIKPSRVRADIKKWMQYKEQAGSPSSDPFEQMLQERMRK